MPMKPPRICGCGYRVAAGIACPCQRAAASRSKAKHDRKRPSSSARGYGRKWAAARKVYLETHPFCTRCGAPATVVDHIIPHKGDQSLLWDQSNWQALCAHDHNSAKQSEDRRAERTKQ